MNPSVALLIKVAALSLLLSIAIKAVGPLLPLPQTTASALVLVLSPTLVMLVLLAWRRVQTDG